MDDNDGENDLIWTQPDNIIGNVRYKIICQENQSEDDNSQSDSSDDNRTSASFASMPSLMGPGSDVSNASTESYYTADNKDSRENPLGAPRFHVEGLEVLDDSDSDSNGPETDVSMYSNDSEQSSTYTPVLQELVDCPGGTGSEIHMKVKDIFQGD